MKLKAVIQGLSDKVMLTFFTCLLSYQVIAQIPTREDTLDLEPFDLIDRKISKEEPFKSISISVNGVEGEINDHLPEVLRKNSSVFIKSYGAGTLATPSFRGSGAGHTQVYWNGVAINSPSLGQLDLSLVPSVFLDNVSIRYGGASLTDGSGGLGGSIALDNKANWNRKQGVAVVSEMGSFGTYRLAAQLEFGVKQWFLRTRAYQYAAENDYEYTDITEEKAPKKVLKNADFKQRGFSQEVYRKLNNRNLLAGRLWFQNSIRNLPGTIIEENLASEDQSDESLRSQLEWKRIGDKSTQLARSTFINESLNYRDSVSEIDATTLSKAFNNQIYYSYYPIVSLKVKGGFVQEFQWVDSESYSSPRKRNFVALHAELDKSFGKYIELNSILRQELYDQKLSPFLANIGMRYGTKKASFRLNAGRLYRVPSLNDLYWEPGGNPELDPEFSNTLESGVSFAGEWWSMSSTAFYSKIDNWIIWLPTNSNIFSAQNIKKVESRGVEVSARIELIKRGIKASAFANYGYTQSRNKQVEQEDDPSLDKQLIYVPEHTASDGMDVSYKSYNLTVFHSFISKRFIASDHSIYLPFYNTVDIRISKEFKFGTMRFSLGGAINNLLDEEYHAVAWRPMPGRNYSVQLGIYHSKS